MAKAEQEKTGLRGQDKTQADLRGVEPEMPEGLTRPRKGPIDKDAGRLHDEARDDEAQGDAGKNAGGIS